MGDRIFTVADLEFRLVENKAPAFQVGYSCRKLSYIQILISLKGCDVPLVTDVIDNLFALGIFIVHNLDSFNVARTATFRPSFPDGLFFCRLSVPSSVCPLCLSATIAFPHNNRTESKMLADFSATLAAFKTALQSLKAIQEAKTGEQVRIRTAELNLIVLDLQEKLSTLYAQNLTLQSRNAELERKIRDIEQQRAHLSRYELHRHEAGGLVYRHEQDIGDPTPAHNICTHCYHQGIQSVLQFRPGEADRQFCPQCGNEFAVTTKDAYY